MMCSIRSSHRPRQPTPTKYNGTCKSFRWPEARSPPLTTELCFFLLDTGCLLSPPAPIAVANGGGENFYSRRHSEFSVGRLHRRISTSQETSFA
jgi:hypothetical protein